MLDVKIHNRQAAPLKRRQTILKADGDGPMTDVISGLRRLFTPLILVPMAVAAAVGMGLYLGHS